MWHTRNGQHLPSQKTLLIWVWSCCNFATPSSGVEPRRLALDNWAFVYKKIAVDHDSSSVMTFLRKSGSLAAVWIKSVLTAARCSFCSGSRSHRTHFATTHFMPRSCIKISDSVVFGIPRSASCSRAVSCQSLLIASHTHSTFSGVLLITGLLECELSKDFQPSLKHLCHTFICAMLIVLSLKSFWIIRIVSAEEWSSLTQNLMQIGYFTCSVILNATATQYTCSLNGIYHPHWLVQWSRHCSHVCIPVHSPWLPGHTNVMQTLPVILTMVGACQELSWAPLIH